MEEKILIKPPPQAEKVWNMFQKKIDKFWQRVSLTPVISKEIVGHF